MLPSRDIWHYGTAPGRNEYPLGAECALADCDVVRIAESTCPPDPFYPGAVEQFRVDAIETLDLSGFIVPQRRPVKVRLRQPPAIAGGGFEILCEVRAVDKQLLRYTADVDAGATEKSILDHGYPRTVRRGHARGPHAAGASAEDHEVVIEMVFSRC